MRQIFAMKRRSKSTSRKRAHDDERDFDEDEDIEDDDMSHKGKNRKRFVWSDALHKDFIAAGSTLA